MDLDHVELTLLPAPDDPERVCYEIQAKLLGIREYLRKHGVGAISVGAHPAGDTHMGQFIITLGPAATEAIAAVAGAWVQTRLGRRIRLKFDDVEVEVRTTHEIDALLKRVYAPAQEPKDDDDGRVFPLYKRKNESFAGLSRVRRGEKLKALKLDFAN